MVHIRIDADKCVGCRTCEIACSFHHRKVFDPKIGSLEIREAAEWPKISILLYENQAGEATGSHLPCDACEGEPAAICSKYCPVEAIRVHAHGGCRE
jgi:anaerobic carbon-monoxide dehydrogenase iron sulfur subunit